MTTDTAQPTQRVTYLHDRYPVGPLGRLIAARDAEVATIDPSTGERVSVGADGTVNADVVANHDAEHDTRRPWFHIAIALGVMLIGAVQFVPFDRGAEENANTNTRPAAATDVQQGAVEDAFALNSPEGPPAPVAGAVPGDQPAASRTSRRPKPAQSQRATAPLPAKVVEGSSQRESAVSSPARAPATHGDVGADAGAAALVPVM